MKLVNLLYINTLRAQVDPDAETQEVTTKMQVHENQHTFCDAKELSPEFECHEVDNFTRCSSSCGDGMVHMRRCECYRDWMMIVMYDENACKWNTFDDSCVEIRYHSEGHLYPHYPKPTTTTITTTTTQATSTTTAQPTTARTHNPKFENVRRFTSGKFKQIKSNGHGSGVATKLRKPLKPLTSLTTKHTMNHFSHFLRSLHHFAKATLVGIDRGAMQKVAYNKL